MNYIEAKKLFETARNKDRGKPLENNTYLIKTSEKSFGVKLHNTVVVEIFKNGSYKLNSGGWLTFTTKDRINSYSPARLFQEKNQWFLMSPDYRWQQPKNERDQNTFIYFDNIVIDQNGIPLKKHQKSVEAAKAKSKAFDKVLTNYVNGFLIDLMENGFDQSGDCLCCMAIDAYRRDPDHLYSHLKESYFVHTILVNACKESGRNPHFWLQMILYNLENDSASSKNEVKRLIRKHFNARRSGLLELFKEKDFKKTPVFKIKRPKKAKPTKLQLVITDQKKKG